MLPQSYNYVSEETKQTVQLFIARASNFLQGEGQSDEEVNTTIEKVKEGANKEALALAVTAWEQDRQLFTAELFVQWFAGLVWAAVKSDGQCYRIPPWPYQFKELGLEGPLSLEFLEAVRLTEEEALCISQMKKKPETPDKRQRLVKEAEQPFYPEPLAKEPETLKAAILHTLLSGVRSPSTNPTHRQRKNSQPEATIPQGQRGNDGSEEAPAESPTQLPAHMDWPGAPVTADQFMYMNAGLMETIWETRIYDGDNIYHDAGPFAVKIPKDKAWLALGQDFDNVRGFIYRGWPPLQLYTCDLGDNLLVGLWISKTRVPMKPEWNDIARYRFEELYNILRYWSFQAHGTETQSLWICLFQYLLHAGRLP